MKNTAFNINGFVKTLEKTSHLCVNEIEVHNEYDETIIRYKDGNNYTISVYITKREISIGYLLEDTTYKWFCTVPFTGVKNSNELFMYLGLQLYRVSEYIENYVID
jgi:hypothetical protein